MRKGLFAIALTAGLAANSAFAADLPSRAPPPVYVPPPPIFTWTGFYIGGQLGYEWGRSTRTDFLTATGAAISSNEVDPNGVTGGLHVGYNWEVNQFVLGLEGDVNGSSYRGNGAAFGGFGTASTRTDVDGSLRGRIGWAWDRVLIYGTGGAAFAPLHHVFNLGGVFDSDSPVRVGWTAGGGIEYALDNFWSIRAEYRYTDFGHDTLTQINTTGGAIFTRFHDTDNRVQAGFSYRFNAPPPPPPPMPVVAKY